ncbi:hypothetical protein [Nocardia sp. NPDC051463]|uniref:hypothetical protein n=1 Tax=Nocardia sp. NPDC051463 TaxID=3154845 RepID=UPI00341E5138
MNDPHGQPELPKPDLRGATAAFIALILGLLTGIAGILWVLYVVAGIEDRARDSSVEIGHTNLIMGIAAVAIGLLWCVGGFLLLAEKTAGRVLLILASGVVLIASSAQLFNGGFAYLFIPTMVSLLILLLCVVPATGRGIAADESEPNPLAHGQDQY